MGYGLWVMGYELSVISYELWVMGYELSVMNFQLLRNMRQRLLTGHL
jgi:hypothetical protein